MKSSKLLFALLAALIQAAVASAGSIDMNDPRRALGRQGDVRVDAQLVRETVTPGSPVGITYQVQNLSGSTVAIADRVSDASYDEDNRTITVVVGSEVPQDGHMPHMILIAPGEKRVLQAAATPFLPVTSQRATFASAPRFVQVKVALMRDVQPFVELILKQESHGKYRLPDALFEKWFECNETIFLNAVPVRFLSSAAGHGERGEDRGKF